MVLACRLAAAIRFLQSGEKTWGPLETWGVGIPLYCRDPALLSGTLAADVNLPSSTTAWPTLGTTSILRANTSHGLSLSSKRFMVANHRLLIEALRGKHFIAPHFSDAKTEAQRGPVTCPKLHG